MPTALAIDTTSADLSLAVAREDGPPRLFHERVGVKATARLFAELDALLRAEGLAVGEVGLYVVAVGPGSFTGTRIGMAVAATLAQIFRKPLIGIDTLHLLAARTEPGPQPFHALLNCARNEVYHAPFRWEDGVPRAQANIGITTFDALPHVVGEAPVVVRRFEPAAPEGEAAFAALARVPLRHPRPDATLLLELGLARYRERPEGPFPTPRPVYLKSEAFRTWQR